MIHTKANKCLPFTKFLFFADFVQGFALKDGQTRLRDETFLLQERFAFRRNTAIYTDLADSIHFSPLYPVYQSSKEKLFLWELQSLRRVLMGRYLRSHVDFEDL